MYGSGLINKTCYDIRNNIDTFSISNPCSSYYIYAIVNFQFISISSIMLSICKTFVTTGDVFLLSRIWLVTTFFVVRTMEFYCVSPDPYSGSGYETSTCIRMLENVLFTVLVLFLIVLIAFKITLFMCVWLFYYMTDNVNDLVYQSNDHRRYYLASWYVYTTYRKLKCKSAPTNWTTIINYVHSTLCSMF